VKLGDYIHIGKPYLVLPYKHAGCLDRLLAWLLWLLSRLALMGVGFVAGCAYHAMVVGK
jgi:hypothetical protein